MVQKPSNRKKPAIDKDDSWYKNPSLIISIASIALSAIVGVLSILNSNSIARLDKEIYIPILQYKMGQEEAGFFYFEVLNQGLDSARGVIVDINWESYIQLSECSPQPPHQDIKPIEPQLVNNLTYRLNILEMDGTFKIICKIDGEGNTPVAFQINTNALSATTPAAIIILPAGVMLPPELNLSVPISSSLYYDSIIMSPGSISMSVFAENARSAINAEQLSPRLEVLKLLPIQTATPMP